MHSFAEAYTAAMKSRKLVLMPAAELEAGAPEHSPLGCSSADRWMVCAGAPQMEANFPDHPTEEASEGTAAHAVREKALLCGCDVEDLIDETFTADGREFVVDRDWVNDLQPGIDFIRERYGLLFVEHRVVLDAWIPGEFGTADLVLLTAEEVIVLDLKFGRGLHVIASDTRQLPLYAAGVYENIVRHIPGAPKKYRLIIDQPRVPAGWTEHVMTLDEILLFAEEAAAAAIRTQDPDAELTVSAKGCHYCRAAKNAACPALHSFCFELVGIDPSDSSLVEVPKLPAIDQLSPERRSYVIQHSKLLSHWIDALGELHLDHALKGLPTPGFKAVATQGKRSWVDEQKAEEFWKSKMPAKAIYTQKLKSPTQMEKEAGTRNWKAAQELIHRPEGKPALVPESDKREALIPVINLLDDLDDDLDDLIAADEIQTEVDELDDLI